VRKAGKILPLVFAAACAPSAWAQASPPGYEFSSGGSHGMESEAGLELRQEAASDAGPQPHIQGDVTWMCGGIGTDEAAYMKEQAKGYDLMLSFAVRNGAYLADVDVEISNAQGESLLRTHCDAPIMLVDLPKSGRYRLRADAGGVVINRTVRVSGGQSPRVAAVVMSWPQQLAESPGEAATSSGSSGGKSRDARSGASSAH
jgi:hypothetical protein